ncbi:MAG: hypothetical protein EFT35_00310 [Methanophagales archaeon ANME-1-THS]|nr:MAG: hypothetical protein EFT35_00310 [Methanophagales archaeon ANME-1-THS]
MVTLSEKKISRRASVRVPSIVIVTLFVLSLLSSTVLALGIAVAPTTMEIKDGLRGGEFERALILYNVGAEARGYVLNTTGEAGNWITFYDRNDPSKPIEEVMVPSNGSSQILVKFNIPEDAANGKHEAQILVQTAPEPGGNRSGQTITLGVPVDVTIMVTGTQILTGKVISITTRDTEINYPLRIKVEFQNTGNVVARPDIGVTITKDETVVDEFTYSETSIKVETRETIALERNTAGFEPGDYSAKVTVSLGGKVLATQELPFKILPVGTFSRLGNLVGISYMGTPSVGTTLKILANFTNTGEIESKAKFIGELYTDDVLMGTISSEELLVPVGETVSLNAYLKIERSGSYTLKGYVVYDGKMTGTEELSFEAKSVAEPTSKPTSKPVMGIPDFGALGAGLAVASVSWYMLHRRRRTL